MPRRQSQPSAGCALACCCPMNRNDLLPFALMQVDVSRLWTTVASIVIAFSFIFGTSIRQMYESVIFLFVVHPFDVGDALIVLADYHVVSWCWSRAATTCLCLPAERVRNALRFRLAE